MYSKIAERNALTTSRLMAIVGVVVLLTYMVEAIEQKASGRTFLAMDAEVKGMVFGISSVALFIAAFALELRERSMITSGLLISGGATMGTLALAKDALSDAGIAGITTGFANSASVGYVIMGLGILHLVKLRESRD